MKKAKDENCKGKRNLDFKYELVGRGRSGARGKGQKEGGTVGEYLEGCHRLLKRLTGRTEPSEAMSLSQKRSRKRNHGGGDTRSSTRKL